MSCGVCRDTWLAGTLLVCTTLAGLSGDQLARAQRPREEQPRFVLNTGGPVNLIQALAFSPDSTRLYAAGNDKVVFGWAVREVQHGEARATQAQLVQTLRWELTRGLRGVIYAMDAAPNSRLVAVAGYSARGAQGDILLYDTARGQVERALFDDRDGHRNTIAALAFSPDGSQLASISVDGELRVWTLDTGVSRLLARPRDWTHSALSLAFLSHGNYDLAVSFPGQASTWRIALYDTSGTRRPIALRQEHEGSVTALVRDPNPGSTAWASADAGGRVYIWKDAPRRHPKLLRDGPIAEDLAFGPQSQLLVATQLTEGQAMLELWDSETARQLDRVRTSSTESNFACVVSPNGDWAATCGDNETPIHIFRLKDHRGRLLNRPLTSGRSLPIRGQGFRVGKVAFDSAADSYKLAFGAAERATFNDYGRLQRAFDLKSPQLLSVEDARWVTVDGRSGSWDFVQRTRHRVDLVFDGQPMGTITLDPTRQGSVRSICWLRDNQRVFGIAVGTDLQNGIFVYRLVRRGECRLLRYYRDHTGWVTSLSVSSDGRYLASGSTDGSIKIWSLEGLQTWEDVKAAEDSDFAQETAWGAVMRAQGQTAVVTSVTRAGIAASRGLQVGDVIVKAFVGSVPARDALTAIREAPIYGQLKLVFRRGDEQATQVAIVPAWEPLMTLFVSRNEEWALSTPQGPYDASVDGDELVGWQLNRGRSVTPDFFRADQFRDTLERPDIVRKLLFAGNLFDAQEQAGERSLVRIESAKAPRVLIDGPTDGQSFASFDVPVRLTATIRSPDQREQSARGYEISGYLNGRQLIRLDDQMEGSTRRLVWEMSSRERFNSAVIIVEREERDETVVSFADVSFRVQDPKHEDVPRLHILGLAVSKSYQEGLQLAFPVDDAVAVEKALRTGMAGLYRPGMVTRLYESDVDPQQLQESLDQLGREVGPNDLLVVFVAGHGVAVDGHYYFIPPDPKITSLLPEQLAVIRERGISWAQFEQLVSLPCRKLVLLDTCHAGNALLKQRPPSHMKAALRRLKRHQMLVIAGSSPGEPAYELPRLGHGFFTSCLLDGLKGAADVRRDGEIDVEEIGAYVTEKLPQLSDRYIGRNQVPRVSSFSSFLYVPLTRY